MIKTLFTLILVSVGYTLSSTCVADAADPSDKYTNPAIQLEDGSSGDGVYFLEFILDRPAKDVWPYLQSDKLKLWAPVHSYYPVSGVVGSEGHRYKSMPVDEKGNDLEYPIVRYELIKVIPNKLYVGRLDLQDSAHSARRLISYGTGTLDEIQGKTRFRHIQVIIHKPGLTDEERRLIEVQQMDIFRDVYSQLKKIVETQS